MASDDERVERHSASTPGFTPDHQEADTGHAPPGSVPAGSLNDDIGTSETDPTELGGIPSEYLATLTAENLAELLRANQIEAPELPRAGQIEAAELGELRLENERCYLPEMDPLREILVYRTLGTGRTGRPRVSRLLRMRPEGFFRHHVYSIDGYHSREFPFRQFADLLTHIAAHTNDDINIYQPLWSLPYLGSTEEFTELLDSLDFAPIVIHRVPRMAMAGLGRRLTGTGDPPPGDTKGKTPASSGAEKYYDIWFQVPLMELLSPEEPSILDLDNPPESKRAYRIPSISARFEEKTVLFYLKYSLTTKKTKVFISKETGRGENILKYCEERTPGESLDPLGFLCCAVADILERFAPRNTVVEWYICKKERFALHSETLGIEAETRLVETAVELQQMIPVVLGQLHFLKCLENVLRNALDEHQSLRDIAEIPNDIFLRTHKNLQTLLSSTESYKVQQESRMKAIDTCLSVLSYVRSFRNDRAVNANTERMKQMAEIARDDSYNMEQIARDTKLDSQTMRIIATMTMLYLPATFVATLFGMDIFNFDFDGGKAGVLSVSSQWWIYLVIAMPLTAATFVGFTFLRNRMEKGKGRRPEETPAL